jgi:hypothetical protein
MTGWLCARNSVGHGLRSRVALLEFVEWTPENHLSHSRFIAFVDSDVVVADVAADRSDKGEDGPTRASPREGRAALEGR